MREAAAQAVAPTCKILEQLVNAGMLDRAAIKVHQQVLLTDIGDVAFFLILGEEVIIGLVAPRAYLFGDLFEPFIAVGEDRIDIENHPAEIMRAVAHDIANGKARSCMKGGLDSLAGLRRKELCVVHDWEI